MLVSAYFFGIYEKRLRCIMNLNNERGKYFLERKSVLSGR